MVTDQPWSMLSRICSAVWWVNRQWYNIEVPQCNDIACSIHTRIMPWPEVFCSTIVLLLNFLNIDIVTPKLRIGGYPLSARWFKTACILRQWGLTVRKQCHLSSIERVEMKWNTLICAVCLGAPFLIQLWSCSYNIYMNVAHHCHIHVFMEQFDIPLFFVKISVACSMLIFWGGDSKSKTIFKLQKKSYKNN
jgi:hypothetical protein